MVAFLHKDNVVVDVKRNVCIDGGGCMMRDVVEFERIWMGRNGESKWGGMMRKSEKINAAK